MRYLRKAWQWLTSMRTAMMLLFLLALAAVPGALLPQRDLNESNVTEFIAANGTVAEIYDRLQLFDVFNSSWFAAIYVLLTISLVGCIVPRSWEHYRAWKTPPTRAPKNLPRLPLHYRSSYEGSEEELYQKVRSELSGWRISEYSPQQDRVGVRSIAAERGYSRELANLIFHIALVAMIIIMAIGRFVYYEGQVIVVTGTSSERTVAGGSANDAPAAGEQSTTEPQLGQSTEFCNTSTSNFDSFRAGNLVDGTGLHPFCFIAHDFSADYLANGQAEMFTSNISYAEGDQIFDDPATWQDYQLRVNHPLRLADNRIYLQGHGFAPTFTVTWPNGESRTQTVQFRPDDLVFFLSSGAMRFDPPAGMYPQLFERRQNQIALQGLFAPTASWEGENGELLTSAFPAMRDPAVAIDIYRGDAGLDTGMAQSIFELDSSLMHSGQLQRVERVNLLQGESVTLDDGVRVTFDGAHEFANYQISYDPTQGWLLLTTLVMLGGLVCSLVIKRRRIWVRFYPPVHPGAAPEVEFGGLARTDRAGWSEEFGEIYRAVLGLPDPDDVEEDELYTAD